MKLNDFDKEKVAFLNVCRKSRRNRLLRKTAIYVKQENRNMFIRRSAYADRLTQRLDQLLRSCPRMYFFRGLYSTAAMTSAMTVLGSI